MIPVILSGGSGTRLWPVSRSARPKQFLPVVTGNTMFQETLLRLQGLDVTGPVVVANEGHRFLVAEQIRELDMEPGAIILEPMGRNSAPAIAVAAFSAITNDPDALMLVLPADHIIEDKDAFHRAIAIAGIEARQGKLVTFGIETTMPHTGYGYIRKGDALESGAYKVERFVEKPDLQTAEKFLEDGGYYWNGGIFLFTARTYLSELENFEPEVYTQSRKAFESGAQDMDFLRLSEQEFEACPSKSVDYAVMERSDLAVVVPLNAGWSDVGSWSALWEHGAEGDAQNSTVGDVIVHDSRDCMIYADHRLVAAVGVEDLVIVELSDAVLVARKSADQDVKEIVARLKLDKRTEHEFHRQVFRPWGNYDCIDNGPRDQVKRIVVNPGAKLSLQLHHHRAEHWVVVKGQARVTKGDEVFDLLENQSTYIPIGVKHSLENPTDQPLEIIEVQSGDYLGEDDIVRFEDIYGRAK